MKTGRSLQDWAKEIERRANAKRDFMVDTRSMEMFNGEQGPQVSLELKDSRLQLGMTENAHRQIGTHLNIPAKYAVIKATQAKVTRKIAAFLKRVWRPSWTKSSKRK